MTRPYVVTYRTPVSTGTATVAADGIIAARAEARQAAHILTGHPPDAITILAVADERGTLLWEETAHVGTY